MACVCGEYDASSDWIIVGNNIPDAPEAQNLSKKPYNKPFFNPESAFLRENLKPRLSPIDLSVKTLLLLNR